MKDIQNLADEARKQGYICVTGALIMNSNKEIFVQKRTSNRRLHPDCWDIIGGHVEDNESIEQSLAREIEEETGWTFDSVIKFVGAYEWTSSDDKYKEFVFLISVKGDLNNPRLETNKVSEGRWISKSSLNILMENRSSEDKFIHNVVEAGFNA